VERLSRAAAGAVYCGGGVVLCRVLARYLMYVPGDDLGVASHLMMEGFWEAWVTLAVARLVRPGWRCVNVGAHVGYYAVLMADLAGPVGGVWAFEPNARLHDLLGRNVEVNGLHGRVRLFRSAVGAEAKDGVPLTYPRRMPGSGSVARVPEREGLHTDSTAVVTLDDALGPSLRPNLMVIDAEGADYDVIQGARETLAANPGCVVVYEHLASFYADPAARLRGVLDMGFRLRHVTYDGAVLPATPEGILGDTGRCWTLVLSRS